MQNTVQLSDAQVIVVLASVKQEWKAVHPDDKQAIAAIHDHIRIQCSKNVQLMTKPLIEW